MPTPTNTLVLQSQDYLLQSRAFQNTIDITVKSVINLAVANPGRTTALANLTDCINDLRTMDTLLWAFINPVAAQTFPVYTTAEKLSRGPFLSNTNSARKTALLVSLVPALTKIKTTYTAQTNAPLILSEDRATTNRQYTTDAAYQAAYADLIAKITLAIAEIPVLAV